MIFSNSSCPATASKYSLIRFHFLNRETTLYVFVSFIDVLQIQLFLDFTTILLIYKIEFICIYCTFVYVKYLNEEIRKVITWGKQYQ